MRLILGTVQFGLPYGATNNAGQTSLAQTRAILDTAEAVGIQTLDTASAYGNAVKVLGSLGAAQRFNIVTKLPPQATQTASLTQQLEEQLNTLKCDKIQAVMLHQADDLLGDRADLLFDALDSLKQQSLITQIGVSVYTPEQLRAIRSRYPLDLVQLPANLFDQRFVAQPDLLEGIEVHARSLFLQGVLLAPPEIRPTYFKQFDAQFSAYEQTCAQGVCPLTLCLSLLNNHPALDAGVVGVCSVEQLQGIIAAYRQAQQRHLSTEGYATDRMPLILPTLWPKELNA